MKVHRANVAKLKVDYLPVTLENSVSNKAQVQDFKNQTQVVQPLLGTKAIITLFFCLLLQTSPVLLLLEKINAFSAWVFFPGLIDTGCLEQQN